MSTANTNITVSFDALAVLASGSGEQKLTAQFSYPLSQSSFQVVKLTANLDREIDLGGLTGLNVLVVRSEAPVDVSFLADSSNNPIFLGVKSAFINFLWHSATPVDHVIIKSAQPAVAEVLVAGV